jgi:hypothetical protein
MNPVLYPPPPYLACLAEQLNSRMTDGWKVIDSWDQQFTEYEIEQLHSSAICGLQDVRRHDRYDRNGSLLPPEQPLVMNRRVFLLAQNPDTRIGELRQEIDSVREANSSLHSKAREDAKIIVALTKERDAAISEASSKRADYDREFARRNELSEKYRRIESQLGHVRQAVGERTMQSILEDMEKGARKP